MLTEPIYVIGAGGHAKVVLDAMLAAGVDRGRIRLSDNNPQLLGTALLGVVVHVPAVTPDMARGSFHVAIGNAGVRARLHAELAALGAQPFTVIHPAAVVSPYAQLGQAVFAAAHALIGPDCRLGDGVIVNHGAVVDHDCRVEAFSHVAPHATLGGAVRVGAQVLIGAGATVLPALSVGDGATVGAGAVVTRNIAGGDTVAGVPAQSLRRK